MRVVVFDTETTGLLPKRGQTTEDFPRLVQLAILAHDTETGHTSSTSMLVDPGKRIPPAATAVHGITDCQVEAMGVTPTEAVITLALALDEADVVVAHNYSYDAAIVKNECKLAGLVNVLSSAGVPEYCTMRAGTQLCALVTPRANGSTYNKYPKLVELYSELFGAPPQGRLHDAAVDSAVTLRCYMMMAHNTSIDPATLGIGTSHCTSRSQSPPRERGESTRRPGPGPAAAAPPQGPP